MISYSLHSEATFDTPEQLRIRQAVAVLKSKAARWLPRPTFIDGRLLTMDASFNIIDKEY